MQGRIGPFDAAVSPGQHSTAYSLGGVGWYRKQFATPTLKPGQRVYLKFDGVYMNAQTWINGKLIGTHPYGYTTFEYDITDHLLSIGTSGDGRGGAQGRAQTNTVAVRVNNNGKNSRWYSGSGIYRHTCTDSPRTESIFRTPIGEHCWGILDYCPAKYVGPRTPASL